jgi:hypothetical protein
LTNILLTHGNGGAITPEPHAFDSNSTLTLHKKSRSVEGYSKAQRNKRMAGSMKTTKADL